MQNQKNRVRSTTVLLVRKDASVALAGDGQVTMGETVMKASARKVRRLYNEQILAGFAGATGDAFSLLTRFESKLEQYHGNLERAAIELSKEWRTDKMLRHLEALLVVADKKSSTTNNASRCRNILSVRHSLLSSIAARSRLP